MTADSGGRKNLPIRLDPPVRAMLDEMAASERRTLTAEVTVAITERYGRWARGRRTITLIPTQHTPNS